MEEKVAYSGKRAGTKVLLRIISVITVIFIVSGVTSFLFFRYSQSRLVQKSKDRLVQNKVDLISAPNQYITDMMMKILLHSHPGATPKSIQAEIDAGIEGKTSTPSQQIVDDMLKLMIDSGTFNDKLAFFAMPPGTETVESPLIVMSSDQEYAYDEIPPELVELVEMGEVENTPERGRIDSGNSYLLFEDGIPEYSLDGEYLVTAYRFKPEALQNEVWFFGFTSMHDELAAVDSFYRTESAKINLVLAAVLAGSILVLILVTFLVLGYLIRKKITKPIEELSDAAEKVMDGDIDVRVPVRTGEEFEGLKRAFNEMLTSLGRLIKRATGIEASGESSAEQPADISEGARKRARGRSSILVQITVIVVGIYIISLVLSLVFFQKSQATLIEKSRQQIVLSTAEKTSSENFFVSNLIMRYYSLTDPNATTTTGISEFMEALSGKKISSLQETMNTVLADMSNKGLHGSAAFEVIPPIPGVISEPTIFTASDDKYIYADLPEELIDLYNMTEAENSAYQARIDDDNTYMLAENGIEELGFEGPHLITTYKHIIPDSTFEFWFYDFKSMEQELSDINDFYGTESTGTFVFMGIVAAVSLLAVILATYFLLSHLISTQITKNIDELSDVAEQVIEGNIDIEVPVSKGDELEQLKRAFNEMLKSLSAILSKSQQ